MKKGPVLALSVILGIVMVMTILSGCSQPFSNRAEITEDTSGKLLATSTPVIVIPTLWKAENIYVAGDEVSHQGRFWRAKWWTMGDEPGTGSQWNTPWEEFFLPVTVTPTNTPTATPTTFAYIENRAETLAASNVTATSATIAGTVKIYAVSNPIPESTVVPVDAKLEYWVQGDSANKILVDEILSAIPPINLSADLTGLIPNTIYEYQCSINYGKDGEVLSFTTSGDIVTPSPTPTATATSTPTATPTTGAIPPWDPSIAYVAGDMVMCPDGRIFIAKWWTTGTNPCEAYDPWGPWELVQQ